jgi:UDPglucose--hexose-1-phosphate uridylyltransferase
MNIAFVIQAFIEYAVKHELIDSSDSFLFEQKVLSFLGVYEEKLLEKRELSYEEIMDNLLFYAYEKNIFEPDTIEERDAFEAKLIDLVMPEPKEVKKKFLKLQSINPNLATDYLYKLSQNVNYIKVKRLKENMSWSYHSSFGKLMMTINLAKPEKDPKDIEKALLKQIVKEENKPLCVICKENEQNYDNARMNLRIVPIQLGQELWHFQYSPYQYYDEHAIILHDFHRPMKITEKTISYLLDFIDLFPEYFIGSNADLPIVGGSIMNHDHFQAGKYHFPIEKAETIYQIKLENIKIEHLKWPLSTIRLTSSDAQTIKKCANKIREHWMVYSNKKLDILANTLEVRHNTITPIVRKIKDSYQVDIILRNNRTSDAFPDGIFHPHADVQHIKKENIGLIEAMGLAILPGRLKKELEEIEHVINNKGLLSSNLDKHKVWINQLIQSYEKIDDIQLREEVGKKFERVLIDAGVFKQDLSGIEAMKQFIFSIIL